MKRFAIDAAHFSDMEGFYAHADRVLCRNFQSGRNLNAFRDILLGGFGRFEYGETIELIWRDSAKSRRDLGYPETVRCLKERLSRCHPTNREAVESDLKSAIALQGSTVYDWLIEIIREQRHIVFREE